MKDPPGYHGQKQKSSLAVVSTRRAQQEFSKYEITPIKPAAEALKIALMTMFFSVDYAFVVQELKDRRKLRKSLALNIAIVVQYFKGK